MHWPSWACYTSGFASTTTLGDELDRAFALEPDNFDVNADLLILYQKNGDPRAAEQKARFEEIKKKQAEDEHLLWRTIEVRPY